LSTEDRLLEQRLEKIREIEDLGFQSYPGKFTFSHSLTQVHETYSNIEAEDLEEQKPAVRVCGRLATIRRQGKAGFCHIEQASIKLQIYVRQDTVGETQFSVYKKLDAGDIVGIEGYMFRTRTGELTVRAQKLEFLAKAILPMPEKWHGLQDIETRYRQRYLDLIANPEVRNVFIQRNRIISTLRTTLDDHNFIEVETPMMQPVYGGALARPFTTHHNTLDIDLFLRIAPELYLKRLIVGGLDRVYEINRNFRNEGISSHHNPEFTMLEFYQAYSDYRDLMKLSGELLRQTAESLHDGKTVVTYGPHTIDFGKLHCVSMKETLVEHWPSSAGNISAEDLADSHRVTEIIKAYNHVTKKSLPSKGSLGELILEIFEDLCEPNLIQPTLVYDYPVEASPLSKQKPEDPNWVERFEIYVGGMEIANAYSELNDPREQYRRFQLQVAERKAGAEETHAMDEDYIRALCYGMPPTAGEGIGIDRLVMILTNSPSIRDVILFPLLRPERDIGLATRLERFEE